VASADSRKVRLSGTPWRKASGARRRFSGANAASSPARSRCGSRRRISCTPSTRRANRSGAP